MQQTLYLMLKEPRPGRVKTRLAAGIGPVAATWWVRHQTARLLRTLPDARWQTVLAVAPDAALASAAWPAHLPRVAQGGGDLGQRMARLLRTAPPGPALVVGGDIPGLTPAHVARAFAALRGADAVFGPAPDGGYWAIGLHGGAPAGFLRNVRWSGPHALSDSIATLPGRRIARADTLADIDTADDLRRWHMTRPGARATSTS